MPVFRLGTRGSPLALTQAHLVRDALAAAHAIAPDQIAIVPIRTTGDKVQDRALAEMNRVLRPGAKLLVLEFSRVAQPLAMLNQKHPLRPGNLQEQGRTA